MGTVSGGRLADRFGRRPVIRVSFAVTALGVAIVLTGLPWVFLAIALTGFALNQSFSLTVTLGQDLPTRIGMSWGVRLGLAISAGGLLNPALGALAGATSLHLAVTVLAAFPLLGWFWSRGCAGPARRPRRAHRPVVRQRTFVRPGRTGPACCACASTDRGCSSATVCGARNLQALGMTMDTDHKCVPGWRREVSWRTSRSTASGGSGGRR